MLAGLSLVGVAGLAGCKDKGKVSADEARANVKMLVELAEKDVAEIDRGLPEGGKKIAERLAKETDPKQLDAKQNAPQVRTALLQVRQQVPDLAVAKSTFFAFTDDKGIAVRNDLEQDTMAGKDLVGAYPALKKALEGEAYVTTQGQFPGVPNPQGPDREWVAGVPVKRDDGSLIGLLVTGWTYRRFANHLQEVLTRELQDRLMRDNEKGKLPILYVFLFDKDGVYGARGAPPADEKALAELGLTAKTANGPVDAPITIADRAFGYGAARVPKLGPDVGIVVLRSEV
ncbi:MAG: hypothetical protein QOI41_4207 [Myxococcales bacterium]|nr:hypothetical protein [Myxococcales bacterium]